MKQSLLTQGITLGSLRQQREGWYAASMGLTIDQNPYSEDMRPMTDWTLWVNGYSDYCNSPYNCTAKRKYDAITNKAELVKSLTTDSDVGDIKTETAEDFKITGYYFEDGSAIIVTPMLLHVENTFGIPFISTEYGEMVTA